MEKPDRDDSSALARARPDERAPRNRPEVHVGVGTLVEEDVRLGGDAAGGQTSRAVEIGIRSIIRRGSQVHDGARIGDRLVTGRNVVIGEDSSLGDDCRVWNNTIIDSSCTIGDRVQISSNCYVGRFSTIADDVTIGPGASLADDPHPGSDTHLCSRGPTIERGAQIGTNATILPFVTIGERALIGAGSVVTHDVQAGVVVAGNPARVLKSIAEISCPLDVERGRYLEPTSQASQRSDHRRGRPAAPRTITTSVSNPSQPPESSIGP
jgi:acetyltransferase-like isoleucine patch superfamily enzyme